MALVPQGAGAASWRLHEPSIVSSIKANNFRIAENNRPGAGIFCRRREEELTTDLAKFGAIRVIFRSSAMHYKSTDKTLTQIARELNVDGIIEGSVQRSGNKVRITAQLIYGPADTHLWAETHERDLQDILSLQDKVACDIANQVKLRLTPDEQARLSSSASVSPEA